MAEAVKTLRAAGFLERLRSVDLTAYNPSADVANRGRSLILGMAAELVKHE